jgi:hypothetical protein
MPRLLEHVNFPKIVTVLAVTFGIALGACGLTALAAAGTNKAGQYVLPLAFVELAVMVLSALGLVLTVIVWIVVAAIGGRGGESDTIKLFDDSDKGKHEP